MGRAALACLPAWNLRASSAGREGNAKTSGREAIQSQLRAIWRGLTKRLPRSTVSGLCPPVRSSTLAFTPVKTTRTRKLPLFFTQVIGSLPRPAVVRDLMGRKDILSAPAYKAALDDCVRFAIRLQELAGLDVVSDGEWRRRHYVGEFLQRIGGFERIRPFHHGSELIMTDVVVRKIAAREPVWARDAEFLARHARRLTKFAIPSPFLIAIRYWHEDFSTGVSDAPAFHGAPEPNFAAGGPGAG